MKILNEYLSRRKTYRMHISRTWKTSLIDERLTECISSLYERRTGCICLYAFGALGQSIEVVCSTFPFSFIPFVLFSVSIIT